MEMNKERKNADAERKLAERQLIEVNRKLDGLITAITEGLRAPGLQQKLDQLEGEKLRLAAILNAPQINLVRLHPGIADSWTRHVAELKNLLDQEETRSEALETIRTLIDHVNIHPRENGGFEIKILDEIARMVEVSFDAELGSKNNKTTLRDKERRLIDLVAGACNNLYRTVMRT